jgi:hypothetical protein
MKRGFQLLAVLILASSLIVGCGQQTKPLPPAEQEVQIDGSKFVLQAEPGDAKNVIDVRKESKEGDEVVIVGKVGGSFHPVVKDRAAFTIVDLSLKACDGDSNCYDFA